ncbi:uncharacterized protein PV09_09459 [Verruconis gallopava]|uniref:Uncharacterized protein n=1 Tax=Verruconis gallopava TaxID=253628 RepID=A0A0D1ZXI2_9PEZI|nr:uncharacterized protein PV09_09459 [Verruconis gallopava]KIV98784.1 hypothetical protein PV09_09459 [Verruconis gallopava]
MSSPATADPHRPSLTASPRTDLLPSLFNHSDETIEDDLQHSKDSGDTRSREPPFDYIEPKNGSLLPPPGFTPFFTMIMDVESGETYHPSTYYIFADDEPDMLSSAALQALDSYLPHVREELDVGAQKLKSITEEERIILVSLNPEGNNVMNATSLAPDWTITNAEIRPAPTFDGNEEQSGDGLMLMIEGLGSSATSSAQAVTDRRERRIKAKDLFEEMRRKGGGSIISIMEDLAQGMIYNMRTLDKVTSWG